MKRRNSVFISYSSKDERFANQIARLLREMEVSYWKAPEMIPIGSSYAREIPRAIRECEIFLLVLSKAAQTSIWVEKELDSAINNRKVIIPIKIDEVPLCELFLFYLNNVQIISYKKDSTQNFKEIREQLERILNVSPLQQELQVEEYTVTKQKNLRKQNDRRTDIFMMNKAPTECKYCGGDLEETGVGIFKCVQCREENYDELRTVRNYLEKEGARPATVIAKETGVPRATVDYFLRQEYLEIPKLAPERLSCQKCGMSIRTGTLCYRCKDTGQGTTIVINSAASNRNKWHSKGY